MSMTNHELTVLQETHDTVIKLNVTVEQCLSQVGDLNVFVNGNGKTGAKSRLNALEEQAKESKRQRRVVWVTTLGVLALVGEGIVNWIR